MQNSEVIELHRQFPRKYEYLLYCILIAKKLTSNGFALLGHAMCKV